MYENNLYSAQSGLRLRYIIEWCQQTAPVMGPIGLYRENAKIAIESEAKDPFGGNAYYVTMHITLPIPEFTCNERNFHCDVLHITTDRVVRLFLDDAIAALQTSR